ncbi:hypothetical protein H6M51_15520 [Rhizobium sp. AQ_MP]|uniref:hypothetical protein n=1 Tax=Rhizobium sp. AQ_MP TaxID=2761536 RepID=UPI00163B0DA5|nr:hypothetical protein [Rhizobium sp. AQ_MP]MBC2774273.1 hypothetical protein [Rhizobium sp. AQ_MP]
MDFDLEASKPSPRRHCSLAWLGVAGGLTLALLLAGSPGIASSSGTQIQASAMTQHQTGTDPMATASIVPASPVRVVDTTAARDENRPLPQSERHLLIVLLFLCFMVMAGGGLALWKRAWQT